MKTKNLIGTVVATIIALSPAFAAAQASTATTPVTAPVAIAYNGVCAKTEYLRHEGVMATQRDVMIASMKALDIKKRDAIATAFLITDDAARMTAMKTAESDFKKGLEALKTDSTKTAMKNEDELFRKNMTACGVKKGMRNGMDEGMKKGFDMMKGGMKKMFNDDKKEDNKNDDKKDRSMESANANRGSMR